MPLTSSGGRPPSCAERRRRPQSSAANGWKTGWPQVEQPLGSRTRRLQKSGAAAVAVGGMRLERQLIVTAGRGGGSPPAPLQRHPRSVQATLKGRGVAWTSLDACKTAWRRSEQRLGSRKRRLQNRCCWNPPPPCPANHKALKNTVQTGGFVGHAVRSLINSVPKPGTSSIRSPTITVRTEVFVGQGVR